MERGALCAGRRAVVCRWYPLLLTGITMEPGSSQKNGYQMERKSTVTIEKLKLAEVSL